MPVPRDDMIPEIYGVTHVALELSSPTRMERYLRDIFGLQLLRVGYWKGEYVRVIGSPHHQQENPGFLILYNRPFIPQGRLRYVAFGVRGQDVESAVGGLRQRGFYDIDDEDILTAPGGLRIKIDSYDQPRPTPTPADDPVTKLVEAEVDPDLPCLVRGIHHMALDIGKPRPLLTWLASTFGLTYKHHDRRGEFISSVKAVGPKDPIGRGPGLLPLFLRSGLKGSRLNHIAFEMADCDEAIEVIESRGAKVDLPGDAMIHGPEEVWYQIDSRDTPFPVDHPANQTGVTFIPYKI